MAGWTPTVFAHESPTRLAGFDAENRLYLFALTVPWALEKDRENFERPATKPNLLFSFQQKSLVTKQTKRPKGEFVGCRRFGFGHRCLRAIGLTRNLA
jgi:hypothetical protein